MKVVIRFVYFDLGNTIVDYHSGPVTEREKDEMGLELMRSGLARAGSPVSWERLMEKFYTPLMKEMMPKGVYNRAEPDVEALIAPLVRGEGITPRELMDLFFQPAGEFAVANYDITDTLAELKRRNRKMGILSNTPIHGSSHEATLKRLGIRSYFSHCLYSFDEGIRKPEKELFLKAISLTNCEAGEVMMVGDNPGIDLDTPASLGMKCLLFDPQGMNGSFGKYPVISRFREIMNHLDRDLT